MLVPALLTVGTLATIYAILHTAVELGAPLLPGVQVMYGQPTHQGWRRISRSR